MRDVPTMISDKEAIERLSNIKAFFFVTGIKSLTNDVACKRTTTGNRPDTKFRECFVCKQTILTASELCEVCMERVCSGDIPDCIDKVRFIRAKNTTIRSMQREYDHWMRYS